jgi:hypothetical protein
MSTPNFVDTLGKWDKVCACSAAAFDNDIELRFVVAAVSEREMRFARSGENVALHQMFSFSYVPTLLKGFLYPSPTPPSIDSHPTCTLEIFWK